MRVRNDRNIDVVNVCFYVGEKEAEESDETNEDSSLRCKLVAPVAPLPASATGTEFSDSEATVSSPSR